MKTLLSITLLVLAALPILAQNRERRLLQEFNDATAKVTAWIEVTNDLERKAKQDGFSLHPNLAFRRASLAAAMDDAELALKRRDWNALRESLSQVRGHLSKLAAAI